MKIKLTLAIILFLFSALRMVSAQYVPEYENGFRLKISDDENRYLRLMFWNQIWVRGMQLNPGTAINGQPADRSFDIGARRMRMIMTGQISPRFLIMAHFGINNQTFINGGAAGSEGTGGYGAGKKPGIFFHDFTSEYAVIPEFDPETGANNLFSLYFGAGLHSYLGVSRISMVSTTNFLTLDSPIFSFPMVEASDQFVRMYGIYAKGKAGKLEYRLSLNKPFATDLQPVEENVAVDNSGIVQPSVGGYFEYHFFEQESNQLPFKVGSYLGAKKVLNLGVGFYHQNDGTMSLQQGERAFHPIALRAVDLFVDLPIGPKSRNMALTSYTGFYDYNFGPNYLRHFGIMNIGSSDQNFTGKPSISGPGNSAPMIGTGTILYNQTGFKFPDFSGGDRVRVQPFMAYTLGHFQALQLPSIKWDWGANMFVQKHNAKVSVQYSLRPNFISPSNMDGYLGHFTLQFQTFL
jgi:hypothetical protein